MRLLHVLDLIKFNIGRFNPKVEVREHYLENDKEYLNIRLFIESFNTIIIICEYIRSDDVVAYGYYMRVGKYEEWWDNRPHHPEISTYPNHRHIGERVEDLKEYSIDKFLIYIKELLQDIRTKREKTG